MLEGRAVFESCTGGSQVGGLAVHVNVRMPTMPTLSFVSTAGDPLIGPSALEAVAAGAVFINPVFRELRLNFFGSQHPFLSSAVGGQYVCNVDLDDTAAVLACVRAALAVDLPPRIPDEMSPQAYLARLERIIEPALM